MKSSNIFSSNTLSLNKKLLSLTFTAVFLLSACGEEATSSSGEGFGNSGSNTDTDFDQGKLIASIVDNVITPTYQQFATAATAQQVTINDYCQQEIALSADNASAEQVSASKTLAQDSWRDAMNSWQFAEMMQLSPLLISDGALRDNIYSWPTQNTCGVDLDVTYFRTGTVNGQDYDIATRTASRKSMVALEYLLFNETLTHSCTGTTTPEGWDNQTEQYRKVARCEFASEVAKDIQLNSQALLTAWLGDDANVLGYANELKTAGSEGSDFETEHQAVNELSDALFYMDTVTKSAKLAEPLGIELNACGSQACPEEVESKYSQHSLENIINNLQAFKLFMQGSGGDGIGFRDYLIDIGDKNTADSLDADIEQVLATTAAYQESLAQALVNNPEQVEQTHAQVKNITDTLKSDFITSLALELPATAAGDND